MHDSANILEDLHGTRLRIARDRRRLGDLEIDQNLRANEGMKYCEHRLDKVPSREHRVEQGKKKEGKEYINRLSLHMQIYVCI